MFSAHALKSLLLQRSSRAAAQCSRGFRSGSSGYQRFGSSGGKQSRLPSQRVLMVLGGGGLVVWVSTRQEIPYTHRRHSILVSTGMETRLGIEAFEQIKASAAEKGQLLPPHHPASQLVRQVGSRIARTAADAADSGYIQHMKDLQWEFAVVDDPQLNAMAAPGGKVVVFTGLLKALQQEDQLAAVLSHEIAHVVARHTAEKLSNNQVYSLFLLLLYFTTGIYIPGGAVSLILELPNSRKMESEADQIGLTLAARACYNPGAAVSVYQILGGEEAKQGGDHMPSMLRTHPMSSARIEAVKTNIPAAKALYNESGCSGLQNWWQRQSGWPE